MDPLDLARWKLRLAAWLDAKSRPEVQQPTVTGLGLDGAYVSLEPAQQATAASANHNRITTCGAPAGMSARSPLDYVAWFREHGVERFFVWVMPGEGSDDAVAWLREAGFQGVRWTQYPSLVRSAEPRADTTRLGQLAAMGLFPTDLTVREVTRAEVLAAQPAMGEAMWSRYARSAGAPGFTHFLAFDGAAPVATAALIHFEDVGYLSFAQTMQSHRRRGAQQALIAARVSKAAELGCRACASDTLTMLPSSLANLQRSGFETVFHTEVLGWGG